MQQVGGMRLTMVFLGTVVVLMKNSDLVTWLKKHLVALKNEIMGKNF